MCCIFTVFKYFRYYEPSEHQSPALTNAGPPCRAGADSLPTAPPHQVPLLCGSANPVLILPIRYNYRTGKDTRLNLSTTEQHF